MTRPKLTITRRMTIGYLVLILISLGAVGYSLKSLRIQNQGVKEIVAVDIRIQGLARKLNNVLLATERLETQTVILRQQSLLEPYHTRSDEISELWDSLPPLPERTNPGQLQAAFSNYQQAAATMRELLDNQQWSKAKSFTETTLKPLRQQLAEDLSQLISHSDIQVDLALKQLTDKSRSASQIVLSLVVIGIILSALVIYSLSASIHRYLRHFTEAIQSVSSGSFELEELSLPYDDEFRALASEFQTMGRKLREIEQQRLDANPLTGLPGNLVIEREIEARLASTVPFAHGFADLDHFKAYNDRYGYRRGSDVIAKIGDIVRQAVEKHGTPTDLVGHVGGDDYIFLTTTDRAEDICKEIIRETDQLCPEFYSDEDRTRGHFRAKDRYGIEREFPLLSISIAVVCSDRFDNPTGQALGSECARMKEHLKKLPGSRYLIDRRRGA